MSDSNNLPAEEMTEEEYAVQLNEQMRIRRDKLSQLQIKGKDPYQTTKFDFDSYSKDIVDNFETKEGTDIKIAGRIMTWRDMGKANFIDIADGKGKIQVYVRINDIGEENYTEFKSWDIGDIIGVSGKVFKTRRGEISIHATSVELLSKSLIPLPEKWHGLKDIESRYRQRYLDLIVNQDVRETFKKRSQIIRYIRDFLDNRGFLEVETPVLHTVETGTAARPFNTHHNTLDLDMLLRIEMELYLKRLIVGGLDRVYEVGRIFRNEGMSVKHNPEFTMVELYQSYTDYHGMMDLVEDLYSELANKICGSDKITYQGSEINMSKGWDRLTMAEAVKKYAGIDYYSWADDEQAIAAAKEHNIPLEKKNSTKGEVLNAFFEECVEDKLIQPTFIYDYPVENSPLAKRKPSEPAFTERFEFFIYAREMGNAFSELNDPIDQRQRFEKQAEEKRAQGINAQVDEDFVNALEYGMPPTGGLGFGLDRLVMLLTDSSSIRDVLLFPTMKP